MLSVLSLYSGSVPGLLDVEGEDPLEAKPSDSGTIFQDENPPVSGEIFVDQDAHVIRGIARVYACGSAAIYASERAHVRCWGDVVVFATQYTSVFAGGRSRIYASGDGVVTSNEGASVTATECARVCAKDNVAVRACDSAVIYANGNATIHALGNSTVYAGGHSRVKACDNSTVYASDDSEVEVESDNVTLYLSGMARAFRSGGHASTIVRRLNYRPQSAMVP